MNGVEEKEKRGGVDVVHVVSVDRVCLNEVSHKYVYVHACMHVCGSVVGCHLRRKREYHRGQ